jgi:hypothetical protein
MEHGSGTYLRFLLPITTGYNIDYVRARTFFTQRFSLLLDALPKALTARRRFAAGVASQEVRTWFSDRPVSQPSRMPAVNDRR